MLAIMYKDAEQQCDPTIAMSSKLLLSNYQEFLLYYVERSMLQSGLPYHYVLSQAFVNPSANSVGGW